MRSITLITALALVACADVDVDDTLPWDGEGESIAIDDAKADEGGEIRVRSRAMTVWLRPVLEVRDDGAFAIRGRASRNLAGVQSFVPDDVFGDARLRTTRTFEVVLGAHEASSLLFGLPLLVALTPVTGERVTIQLTGRARFAQLSGSSSLWVVASLRPVYVDREVRYRATLGVPATIASAAIEGVGGRRDGREVRVDAAYDDVARWAHADRVSITAGTLRKTAIVQLVLARAAITDGDPYDTWPPMACAETTLACLRALDGDDTSSCGDAYPVTRCLARLSEEPASLADRFAADLRAHLVAWYATYGADVAASGGNDLGAAQAAIDPGAIEEIVDPEEDPHAHDLARYRVLRHPDVVWPGSDRAWLGTYDRATGELVEIVDFE